MSGQGRWNESSIPFGRLEEMFDDWVRTMRANRPQGGGSVWAQATREDSRPKADVVDEEPVADDRIRVDEYREDGAHVVRASLPGVDPDRDVELTADAGELRIAVERRGDDERTYLRRELPTGRSERSLPLPERARPDEITASYTDGVLEIRIPLAEPSSESTRIRVSRGS
ncbi:Hsp20/alpha crystallin family protein [Blastococcus sp. SYSU D00669]